MYGEGTTAQWWLDTDGGHAFSRDGREWTYGGVAWGDAEHPRKTAVAFDDGTNYTFTRLERPHLIFDAKGAPTHLVNAAQYGGGKDPGTTGDNGDASYTLVRPILQQGNAEIALTAAAPRSDVLALTRRVADSFVRREDPSSRARCGWEEAALMQGLVATSAATGNATYATLAKAWSEAHSWTVCKADVILTERDAANDMSCGQIYAELYLLDRNATYLRSIHTTLDALARRPQTDDWWWVDAYFMALPAFARLGNITADDALHDKGLALYRDSAIRRGLWSAEDGLYYRDESYFNATTPAGAPVFWARGNAWAIGAMARSLAFTPPTHPAHAVYSTQLRALAAALAPLQGADGMWRASLLDPQNPPNAEATGTAGFAFGIAYGVNAGLLDAATYRPIAEAAWRGLATLVHDDGFLGHCQPAGAHPEPAGPGDTSSFCVGLFLLAGSEVAKLALRSK